VPTEHGGWGLTAEPILLGLLVAPSVAGACIGAAAALAFLARTPLKVLLVDAHRGRSLARTRLARKVAVVEVTILAVLVLGAVAFAQPGFWWPVVVMAPLVGTELWYDMRSRGRRLVPELAGAIGIAGVATLIALADGLDVSTSVALWLVLAARAITAIITVRDQVGRLHGRPGHPARVAVADLVALAVAAVATIVAPVVAVGAVAVVAVIVIQRILGHAPTPRPVILGLRQTALGLVVVVALAVGVLVA
jgi:hypothetical protein